MPHTDRRTAPQRIAIVDDCADGRQALAWVLQAEAIEVRAFAGADEALADLPGFQPDAVLVDLDLAGRGAHALARDIRRHPRLQQALLVAITGWTHARAQAGARAAGFDACVIKPADPDALIALAGQGGREARPVD